MAWHAASETAYDVTKEYPTMMTVAGAVLATSSLALLYARVLAQTGNAELQPWRHVVNSTHSTMLGTQISDPAAVLDGLAWVATLTTFSYANGVLANWTLRFELNKAVVAKWKTVQTDVGPSEFSLEARNFRAGVWVNNSYGAEGHQLSVVNQTSTGWTTLSLEGGETHHVYNRTNFDGSMWKGYYFEADYPAGLPSPLEGVVRRIIDQGVIVYNNMTWGNVGPNAACNSVRNSNMSHNFSIDDPDCSTDVYFYNPDSNLQPNVLITTPNYDILINIGYPALQATRYNDLTIFSQDDFARYLISHEFFHVLQYAANRHQAGWNSWKEGTAVVGVVLDVPRMEAAHPSTSWHVESEGYMDGDRNGKAAGTGIQPLLPPFDWTHSFSICLADYESSLLWALLYMEDGGAPTLKRYMEEVRDKPNAGCQEHMPASIDETLANTSAKEHANFSELFFDLGRHMYLRNFSWVPANETQSHDLGGNLSSVGMNLSDERAEFLGRGLAMRFLEVDEPGTFNISVNSAQAGWRVRMFNHACDGTISETVLLIGSAVEATRGACETARIALNVVRTAATDGTFSVVVTS